MRYKQLVLAIVLFLSSLDLQAGPKWERFKNWVDSADIKGADTNYVSLPKQGFLGSLNFNQIGSRIKVSDGQRLLIDSDWDLSGSLTSHLATLSLGVQYRGWGFSYTRDLKNSGDYEFSYSSYGQAYGAEVRMTRSSSLSGRLTDFSVNEPDKEVELEAGMVHRHSTILNLYYVFSHRKFSLPAAMSYTVIQRQSSGSLLAVFNFHRTHLRLTDDPLSSIIGFNYLSSVQCSLGGGYAYNYIFGSQRFLLHGSVMPMLVFYQRNRFYFGDEGQKSDMGQRISLNANAHLSFVYNVSRYVFGSSSVFNFDTMRATRGFSLYSTDWSSNFFVGMRF